MTITLDASSSSAEGYNDTITQYEWDINDPYNPKHIVKTSPFTTHTFQYDGTFIVELNVTDNEGMWSTTSKPIRILPEFGPTANFTWSPEIPTVNETITFDASSSTRGWSAQTQQFSPIQNYVWNFSDGTGNITVTSATLNHNFTQPGNYTVTLTVIDAVGRSDATWSTVEVQNVTLKVADITGDGVIDGDDLFYVTSSYGSSPGSPGPPYWNPIADINKDGVIDGDDLFFITSNFGKDP